jgi:hypothetical protein
MAVRPDLLDAQPGNGLTPGAIPIHLLTFVPGNSK